MLNIPLSYCKFTVQYLDLFSKFILETALGIQYSHFVAMLTSTRPVAETVAMGNFIPLVFPDKVGWVRELERAIIEGTMFHC